MVSFPLPAIFSWLKNFPVLSGDIGADFGLDLAVMFFVRLGPNEIEILVMLYLMYSNESPSLYMKTHSALTFETQDEISQYPRMCSKRRKNAKGRMHLE